MKKLSIIRFKPKPECFDEFLANMQNSPATEDLKPAEPVPDGQGW